MTIEELLAPFTLEERVRPRRATDEILQVFAGRSRDGLYRLAASGAFPCEKAPGRVRQGQCRAATALFFTLTDVARWRAGLTVNPTTHVVSINTQAAPRAARRSSSGQSKVSPPPPSAA